MPQAKDLKKGDKIIYDNQKLIVESIETSKIGKLGKAKCRIEAIAENKQKKVFITLFDEEIPLQ